MPLSKDIRRKKEIRTHRGGPAAIIGIALYSDVHNMLHCACSPVVEVGEREIVSERESRSEVVPGARAPPPLLDIP